MIARTLITAFSAAALVACSAPDVTPTPQDPSGSTSQSSLNAPFDLGYGRTVSLTDAPLQITFVKLLQDSRCPSGVTCVWEGVAEVQLNVTSGANATSVDLDTAQKSVATVEGFQIQLESVSPYPVSAQQIDPAQYVVRLKISRP